MLARISKFTAAFLCLVAVLPAGAQSVPPLNSLRALEPSPAERAWLDRKLVIDVGIDPTWPPFSFVDRSGGHQGIDADLIKLITTQLGLTVQIAPSRTWQETMKLMDARKVQIVPGVSYHADRSPGFRYTDPYLTFPVAIVTRSDGPFHINLRDLAGKTLALPRDYITTLNVQQDHPRLRVTLTNDASEALLSVARGETFATVENLATATYLIKTQGLTNLKIAGLTDYQFELRFAVADDQPELYSLVNQALKTISEPQFARIRDRWIPVEFAMDDWWSRVGRQVVWVGAGVAALLGLIFFWNRRLAVQLAKNRRMQEELADTNLRLEAANARLRQLNEESELFMNIAAHDLRSPLNIILLSCEMIETQIAGVPGGGPAGRPSQKLIDGIKESVLRMNGLVQNFLSAQVIAHGDRDLARDPIDLFALVKRAIERHTPEAELKRITLHPEMADAAAIVSGDAGALDQVLDNLISNAVKFTPPDGRVVVRLSSADSMVRLEAHDDGPGISPEDLPKLFTRFTKLKSRPTARESSTGLGLSIVKHFVTTMGGKVWCEPTGERGARFIVELPACAPAQSPSG